jgi:hypothetical protein
MKTNNNSPIVEITGHNASVLDLAYHPNETNLYQINYMFQHKSNMIDHSY